MRPPLAGPADDPGDGLHPGARIPVGSAREVSWFQHSSIGDDAHWLWPRPQPWPYGVPRGSVLTELVDLATEGWRRVVAHKVRSLLTLSGLVLGVSALIAMFSFVGAVKTMVQKDLVGLMPYRTLEFVNQSVDASTAANRVSPGLRIDDVVALEGIPGAVRVHALRGANVWTTGPAGSFRFNVQAVTPGFLWDFRMAIERGRELTDLDIVQRHRVAVLGRAAADRLFQDQDPLGREIRIGTHRYTVVGIVRAPEPQIVPVGDQGWREDRIYIPVTTLLGYQTGGRTVSSIWITAADYVDTGPILADAERRLTYLHRNVPDFRTTDYGAIEFAEISELVDQIMTGWNIAMGGIALVSLLVGGIGLFSVLLISVRERVREIGVRQAVGASDIDVRREFLAESMTLAVAGAVIGTAGGAAVCVVAESIARYFGWTWSVPVSPLGVLLGTGFALVTGLLFGLYPARRAASLDPVEAISG